MLALSGARHEIAVLSQGRRTAPVAINLAAGETAVIRIKAGLGGIKLAQETDSLQLRQALARVPMVATLGPA